MHKDVEPTNNRAERALRPSVIYRKITGGTRSERGSRTYATLASVIHTSKLRNQSFIKDTPEKIVYKKRSDPE